MNIKYALLGLMVLSSSIVTLSAHALPDGMYAGATIGGSKMDYTASNQGFTPASNPDKKGFAWTAGIGYQMNTNFALQADFMQYHDVDFTNILGISGAKANYRQNGIDLVGKLMFPFGNGVGVFATGGAAYVKLKRDPNSTAKINGISLGDDDALRPTYGVGVNYDFYPNVSALLQWTQIPGNSTIEQTNYIGIGLNYAFA